MVLIKRNDHCRAIRHVVRAELAEQLYDLFSAPAVAAAVLLWPIYKNCLIGSRIKLDHEQELLAHQPFAIRPDLMSYGHCNTFRGQSLRFMATAFVDISGCDYVTGMQVRRRFQFKRICDS